MKYFLLWLVTIICANAICQDKEKLVGEWLLISLREGKTILDLEKDSIYLPFDDEHPLDTGGISQDSIRNMAKNIMKQFFAEMSVEFNTDNTMMFKMGVDTGRRAAYTINESTKIIAAREEGKEEDLIGYSFEEGRLVLSTKVGEDEMIMKFKKIIK